MHKHQTKFCTLLLILLYIIFTVILLFIIFILCQILHVLYCVVYLCVIKYDENNCCLTYVLSHGNENYNYR